MEAAAALRVVEADRLSMQEMTRQMLEDKYKDIHRQAEEVKEAYERLHEAAAQMASAASQPTPLVAPTASEAGSSRLPQTVTASSAPASEPGSAHGQPGQFVGGWQAGQASAPGSYHGQPGQAAWPSSQSRPLQPRQPAYPPCWRPGEQAEWCLWEQPPAWWRPQPQWRWAESWEEI